MALNFARFAVVIVLGIGELLLVIVQCLSCGNCSAHGHHKIQLLLRSLPSSLASLFWFPFALVSVLVSGGKSGLNFLLLQHTEISVLRETLERFFRARFLATRGWESEGQTKALAWSASESILARSKLRLSGESSGPMVGPL